jgi:hypothetical protein
MLRHELIKFISVDKKLNVIIDPDSAVPAQKTINEIEELRKDIRKDGALLAKVKELKQKYDLSGRLFPNPDIMDLDAAEAKAKAYLADMEKQMDIGIARAKAYNSPDASGPGTVGSLTREKESTLEKEKSEIVPIVERVKKARAELDSFLEGMTK